MHPKHRVSNLRAAPADNQNEAPQERASTSTGSSGASAAAQAAQDAMAAAMSARQSSSSSGSDADDSGQSVDMESAKEQAKEIIAEAAPSATTVRPLAEIAHSSGATATTHCKSEAHLFSAQALGAALQSPVCLSSHHCTLDWLGLLIC